MRSKAQIFGYSPENVKQFGTRSLRIGGATQLFKLGASPDTLCHLGGWSSDAYKAYIRSQTDTFQHLTEKMVRQ